MNKTILSEIESAKRIYPPVLKEVRKFGIASQSHHVFLNDDLYYYSRQKRLTILLKELHKITEVKSANYKNLAKGYFERRFFRELNDYFQKTGNIYYW
jgi:transcription initiation factor TFIIIB Brf1 subunit/transcription initiation factor TFIIB